jgi:hypothetical protein
VSDLSDVERFAFMAVVFSYLAEMRSVAWWQPYLRYVGILVLTVVLNKLIHIATGANP